MKPTTIVAALASIALLAACDTQTDPAQPPTSEAALTTATAAPPPPDDTQTTTEAAPTTEPPTEEADGPPEMPDEATEQTEAGAEAFALHYIDLINYTGRHPEVGLLEPLGAEGCESCRNYEGNVESLVQQSAANDKDAAEVAGAETVSATDTYTVLVDLAQTDYRVVTDTGEVLNEYDHTPNVQFKFTLVPDDPWVVEEIQVSTS